MWRVVVFRDDGVMMMVSEALNLASGQLVIVVTRISRAIDRMTSDVPDAVAVTESGAVNAVEVLRESISIVEGVTTGAAPELFPRPPAIPPADTGMVADLYGAHIALERAAELLALVPAADRNHAALVIKPPLRTAAAALDAFAQRCPSAAGTAGHTSLFG